MRVNETTSMVSRGTSESFRRTVEESRRIPAHNYDAGQMFEMAFLKTHKDPAYQGMMVSWVFFKDFTGAMPSIPSEDIVGDFIYQTDLTVEENIKNYYLQLANDGELDKMNPVKNEGEVPTAAVITPLMKQYNITLDLIKGWIGLGNEDQKTIFQTKYKELLMNYINDNTLLLVDYGAVISVKDTTVEKDGDFHSGPVPPRAEAEELHNKYQQVFYLLKNVVDRMFDEENPGYREKADSNEDAKKMYLNFLSRVNPINKPSEQGVAYCAQTQINNMNAPVTQYTRQLAYYDLRGGGKRQEKITNVKMTDATADCHLDFLKVKFSYLTGSNKKEAGLNMAPSVATSNIMQPTDAYRVFGRVLNTNCFAQTGKFKNAFDPNQADEILKRFFVANEQRLQQIPYEELQRYADIISYYLPESKMAETFKVDLAEEPVQQPAQTPEPNQPAQQQPVQQQPVQQAQQPVQQQQQQPAPPPAQWTNPTEQAQAHQQPANSSLDGLFQGNSSGL